MSKTTSNSGSIVFFGSGPVAAKSLELLGQDFEIEAVVTKPTTVHEMTAVAGNTPVHSVSNKRELDALIATNPFQSKLAVLIDFGIIVSQTVIDYFPLGIINSHFSILPDLRGADPISFAVLSGQKLTGVSSMMLVEAMDEGPLLSYGELPLTGKETTPTLTQDLIDLSYGLLQADIPRRFSGEAVEAPQTVTGQPVSYSRKLSKEDGIIDWSKPAEQIEREIRAYIEWPRSRSTLAGKDVVITSAHIIDKTGVPGTVFVENKALGIYSGERAIIIDTLKPAGKKEMTAAAFLAGYRHLL